MHASRMYAHETRARETHAHEVHAHETRAREMHAHKIHTHEMRSRPLPIWVTEPPFLHISLFLSIFLGVAQHAFRYRNG